MSDEQIRRELRFLKRVTGILTLVLLGLGLYLVLGRRAPRFGEITVERINVVEKNGDLKLVLSNSSRQHSGVIGGKALPERERQAGLIFFNSVGDECGGLVYDGNDREAGLVLSVDKYRDDQIMQLRYVEDNQRKARTYGLQLWDYPKENAYAERSRAFEALGDQKTPQERQQAVMNMKKEGLLPEDRLFLGQKMNRDLGLFINDRLGRPRIRLYVDAENQARIELLDEQGRVVEQTVGAGPEKP